MARKIKFALEMKDGAKVRSNLEELRENFDLEKAVGYFLSGKLVEWLEDRYYEDEAEKLEVIDKDAPDLRARLCEALGVECEDDAALDVEALERLNEKKAVLRQKTSDETIIANADKTALTQEDLADLLDMDEPVIYLCGDSFNVPARVKNKKYVGVLGTPTISIKANSQEDLDAKGIVFENVKLPWGQTEEKKEDTKDCPLPEVSKKPWRVPKAKLKMLFAATFKTEFEHYGADPNATFLMVNDEDQSATANLTPEQKETALTLICVDEYTEDELIHLRISRDMTRGWAFTRDSFCVVDEDFSAIFPYESLADVTAVDDELKLLKKCGTTILNNKDRSGSCPVLSPEYLLLPDGTNGILFSRMLTYRDLHDGSDTDQVLSKYLANMKNMFRKK